MSASLALRALSVLSLATCVVAWKLPEGPLRTDPGQVVEVETAYQTIRVVEAEDEVPVPGDTPLAFGAASANVRTRFLRFDEDSTSYQSVHPLGPEGGPLTSSRYYDHLALGLWFDEMPWTLPAGGRAPRVLIVGYAGGTLDRVIGAVAPAGGKAADVLGVEIDPGVLALAEARLDPSRRLPPTARVVTGADGRAVVDALPADARFDLIVVDAYQRTQYIPFQLATVEFFRACARHLEPAGAIGFNVNAPKGLSGRLLRSIATSLDRALEGEGGGGVFIVPNPHYVGNAAVWGTHAKDAPRVSALVPPSLVGPTFALERLLVRHVPGTDGGDLLTDDCAPTERLVDETFLPVDDR